MRQEEAGEWLLPQRHWGLHPAQLSAFVSTWGLINSGSWGVDRKCLLCWSSARKQSDLPWKNTGKRANKEKDITGPVPSLVAKLEEVNFRLCLI